MAVRSTTVACLAVASVLTGFVPAASAQTVERLPGRVLYGSLAGPRATVFDELWAVGFPTGASIRMSCTGARCSMRDVTVRSPASGLMNLARRLPTRRFRTGTTLTVSALVEGLGVKQYQYHVRRTRDPLVERSCLFDTPIPGQAANDCAAPCPAPPGVEGSYCQGAGEVLRLPSELTITALVGRTSVRFVRARLTQILPGTVVGLFCSGRCPFGARLFVPGGSSVNAVRSIRRLRFPTRMRFEIRLYRSNSIGQVLRATFRGPLRTAVFRRLCVLPTATQPTVCP